MLSLILISLSFGAPRPDGPPLAPQYVIRPSEAPENNKQLLAERAAHIHRGLE